MWGQSVVIFRNLEIIPMTDKILDFLLQEDCICRECDEEPKKKKDFKNRVLENLSSERENLVLQIFYFSISIKGVVLRVPKHYFYHDL